MLLRYILILTDSRLEFCSFLGKMFCTPSPSTKFVDATIVISHTNRVQRSRCLELTGRSEAKTCRIREHTNSPYFLYTVVIVRCECYCRYHVGKEAEDLHRPDLQLTSQPVKFLISVYSHCKYFSFRVSTKSFFFDRALILKYFLKYCRKMRSSF